MEVFNIEKKVFRSVAMLICCICLFIPDINNVLASSVSDDITYLYPTSANDKLDSNINQQDIIQKTDSITDQAKNEFLKTSLFTTTTVSAAGIKFCDIMPLLCIWTDAKKVVEDANESVILYPKFCKDDPQHPECWQGFGGGGSGGGGGAGRSWSTSEDLCFDENNKRIKCFVYTGDKETIFPESPPPSYGRMCVVVSLSTEYEDNYGQPKKKFETVKVAPCREVITCRDVLGNPIHCDTALNREAGIKRKNGSMMTAVGIFGNKVVSTQTLSPPYNIDPDYILDYLLIDTVAIKNSSITSKIPEDMIIRGNDGKPKNDENYKDGIPIIPIVPIPWGDDNDNGIPNWADPTHPNYGGIIPVPDGNPGTFPDYGNGEGEPDKDIPIKCDVCSKLNVLDGKMNTVITAINSYDNKFNEIINSMKTVLLDTTEIKRILNKEDQSCSVCDKLDTLTDLVISIETKFDNSTKKLDSIIDEIKKVVEAVKDINITNESGTTIWDFLTSLFDRIFDFLDGLIDTIISLVIPSDSSFINKNITEMSNLFKQKFAPVDTIKQQITSSIIVEQKEFKDLVIESPQFGTVTILNMEYVKQAIPVFRNLISGFLILVTAIWAYRKLSSGVIK